MTDPFEQLRAPATPVDPDPDFAHRLRVRLERALALPTGVIPVPADTDPATQPVVPRPAAVPYLAVADAPAAIDWYVEVFGATVVGEPIGMPDGRIGHCELAVGAGVLYLADEHPEIGVTAPRPGESPVSLMLPVADADGVRARALRHGATGDREPYDGYGQRTAWIVDPFGHRWGLHSPLPGSSTPGGAPVGYRHGDVMHVAFAVPDIERTRAFYAAALGWSYLPDGRVAGATPSVGFRTGDGRLSCTYAVTDLPAALAAVRAAGGEPGETEHYPWGTVAECADDQGTPFRLFAVAGDPDAPPPPEHGARPGDLAYLTVHVTDSARARAFYGAVLGWQFERGRVEDGWMVRGVRPMTGLAGGQRRATVVPMWRVTDIAAATAAVRAHGGTATEPAQQPYGLTSECTDDQGVPFYLGVL